MTVRQSNRSSIRRHFNDVASEVATFLGECVRSFEVTTNAVVSIAICVLSLEAFSRMKMADIIHFSDVSYVVSDENVSSSPLAIVSGASLVTDSVCLPENRLCNIGYPAGFHPGASGILAYSFTTFNQNEFSVPHLMAVAMWFTTPISLFLLANQTWDVFKQWMWWGLYFLIFLWELIGFFTLLLLNYAPMYNKLLVFVYFLYSFMLIYSVRETWMLRSAENKTNDAKLDRGRMDTEIPSFMQKLVFMSTYRQAYKLAADGDDFEIAEVARDVPNAKTFTAMPDDDGNRSALAPEVVTHTFTRSVLILCEFFFIAPVIYVSAFVLVQERSIPVEVQVRHWQASVLFGIVVLIEKSRKTCLSYVTDTVLSMAGLVSVLAVLWTFIPELVRVLSGIPDEMIPSSPGGVVLYLTFALCLLVVVVNLLVSFIFILFIGKDETLLSEFQNADASSKLTPGPKRIFLLAVNTMYYLNVLSLCCVKFLLLVSFALGWLDNRVW
jgi:hypothetical protein